MTPSSSEYSEWLCRWTNSGFTGGWNGGLLRRQIIANGGFEGG
jgi:hypothetical protein